MRPNLQPTAVSVAAGYLRDAEDEVIAAQAAAKAAVYCSKPCAGRVRARNRGFNVGPIGAPYVHPPRKKAT